MTVRLPQLQFGPGISLGAMELSALVEDRFASRLHGRDATLWGEAAEAEASVRLGWVDAHSRGTAIVSAAEELRTELGSAGVDRIVLCGMGGSSLAPEVITRRDWAPLVVLDSTHPEQVRRALRELERTAVVVSSKSGSTVETRSQLAAFEAAFAAAGISATERIVVVTDPGSALQEYARSRGYRVFLADPEVGGRFSALTAFGLVPSVLAGADARGLIAEAEAAAEILFRDSEENPALRLAAALAAALPARYLGGAFETQVRNTHLADWIEQLVAESTGKDGRGVLPIALPQGAPELEGELPENELLIELRPEARSDAGAPQTITVSGSLGGLLLTWEVATAALGRLIGVDPFNQPDVEAAKVAARAALAEVGSDEGAAPTATPAELLTQLRAATPENGYVVVQAYLDAETDAPLNDLRAALVRELRVPVALGFGPRYLHSTGQFHKGGPALGVFLQVVDGSVEDLPIPGADGADSSAGFAGLIAAQAKGDRDVLSGLGRPVRVIDQSEVAALLAELRG